MLLKAWWRETFYKEGMSHKMNFTWARYFMEVCDIVREGGLCLRHVE